MQCRLNPTIAVFISGCSWKIRSAHFFFSTATGKVNKQAQINCTSVFTRKHSLGIYFRADSTINIHALRCGNSIREGSSELICIQTFLTRLVKILSVVNVLQTFALMYSLSGCCCGVSTCIYLSCKVRSTSLNNYPDCSEALFTLKRVTDPDHTALTPLTGWLLTQSKTCRERPLAAIKQSSLNACVCVRSALEMKNCNRGSLNTAG